VLWHCNSNFLDRASFLASPRASTLLPKTEPSQNRKTGLGIAGIRSVNGHPWTDSCRNSCRSSGIRTRVQMPRPQPAPAEPSLTTAADMKGYHPTFPSPQTCWPARSRALPYVTDTVFEMQCCTWANYGTGTFSDVPSRSAEGALLPLSLLQHVGRSADNFTDTDAGCQPLPERSVHGHIERHGYDIKGRRNSNIMERAIECHRRSRLVFLIWLVEWRLIAGRPGARRLFRLLRSCETRPGWQ
jgi:hypothetical protein